MLFGWIENKIGILETKNRTTIWSSHPISGYISKEIKISQRDICTLMLTLVLVTIIKILYQSSCRPVEERVKKL